MSLNAKY